MVSAGLDTVPGNVIMGIAYLSTKEGQEIQEKALNAINEAYPDGDAWEKCLVEEKIPYVTALVKEILRYWTVIPICLPRTSIKDIPYKDAIIPAGTTFFMVFNNASVLTVDTSPKSLTSCRMRMLRTMTKKDSKTRMNSSQSVSSMIQKLAHRIMPTVLAQGCVQARTSQIASFSLHTSGLLQLSEYSLLASRKTHQSWTRSSAAPIQPP